MAISGAGIAGFAAERSARRAGARTLLIDPHFAGTTCALTGCMPSKLLIAAGIAVKAAADAHKFGIITAGITVDDAAVMDRIRKHRDKFVASTRQSIRALPQDAKLTGRARFRAPTTLQVGERAVTAGAVVVATGSAPSVPKSFRDLPNILTSDNLFDLEQLPPSLAVIGAAPPGLELAQALARLGGEVAVFDDSSSVSGLHDSAAAQTLLQALTDAFELHQKVTVQPQAHADGVLLRWSGHSSGERLFSHVLVATGRTPCLGDLDLDTTGFTINDDGVPLYNRHTMQCGDAPVFLAGDATKDSPVLHEASSRPVRLAITDPQSAIIGSKPGPESLIASADYDDQGRAVIEARAIGRIVIYAAPDGTLTGATLVAPAAEHLAHLLA